MKIAITANEGGLNAPASPVFGHCPMYAFVDTETMRLEMAENPAVSASRGAGIKAAMFVIEHEAQAVLAENIGPNAFDVFCIAGVPVYTLNGDTVQEAVDAYRASQLQLMTGANAQAGMGTGMSGGCGGEKQE